MNWDKNTLWAKARIFAEKALQEDRTESTYGLWSSFVLELLARAAIASISPSLLAEPDREQKNLLYALGKLDGSGSPKSLDTTRVFDLCLRLVTGFTKEMYTASLALINRRNEELHTGAAAFEVYKTSSWAAGYYEVCEKLCFFLDESLESLFNEEEAQVAAKTKEGNRNEIKQKVNSLIASHRKVFEAKDEKEKQELQKSSKKDAELRSYQGRHAVECPACNSIALVAGETFGKVYISQNEDEIVCRQTVVPSSFKCSSCELKLEGYVQLEVCGLGGHYTRRTSYAPSEYYGLIEPDDLPNHVEEYMRENMREFDNE